MTWSRTTVGGAALMVTLAAPAAASAAGTVQPAAPCVRYVPTDPPAPTLGLTAEGWAPGSTLTFKVGAREVGIGQTDTAGGFTTGQSPFTPPEPKGNLQSTTLTADDGAGGFASSPLKIVRLTVDVPDRAKPSQRVRYRAFGFRPGARLYLFVRRGGKTRGRFVLGRPKGACGTLAKRLRYMPLRTWKPGLYEYWYSQSARYSKTTRIYGYRIRISRS